MRKHVNMRTRTALTSQTRFQNGSSVMEVRIFLFAVASCLLRMGAALLMPQMTLKTFLPLLTVPAAKTKNGPCYYFNHMQVFIRKMKLTDLFSVYTFMFSLYIHTYICIYAYIHAYIHVYI